MAKLFEVVSVSELPVQREIVACMPEVVDDSLHPDVCQRFKLVLFAVKLDVVVVVVVVVENQLVSKWV